ncbi:hypothetical protein BB561_004234 [Smittium simulii]|uniref:Uncharacterized protein n=1 Tax=Smittium simulii TaxID=133385 RepID=A0A2T9YHE0_9FUNG|nr:hypothetical protein BB561_004234 [Smittium simulii]
MLRNSSGLLDIISGDETDAAPNKWFEQTKSLSPTNFEQEDNVSIDDSLNGHSVSPAIEETKQRSQTSLKYISNDETSNAIKGASTKPNRSQSLDAFSQRRRKAVARDEDWFSGSSLSSLNSFTSESFSATLDSDLSDLSDWSSITSSLRAHSDKSDSIEYHSILNSLDETGVTEIVTNSQKNGTNNDISRSRYKISSKSRSVENEKSRIRSRNKDSYKAKVKDKNKAQKEISSKKLYKSESNNITNNNNRDAASSDSFIHNSADKIVDSFYKNNNTEKDIDLNDNQLYDEYRIRFRRKPGRRRKVDLLNPNRTDDQGKPQLLYFASRGDADSCKKLIKHGAYVDCRDKRGWTVLHEAARQGDIDLASFIIKVSDALNTKTKHISINSQNLNGNTPLHEAVAYQNYEMVMFLLHNGARVDIKNSQQQSPININKSKHIKKLLEKYRDLLLSAMATNKAGQIRLHRECREGNIDDVIYQLNLGIDIDTVDNAGWTPLHEASLAGHSNLVKELLRRNASVHKKGLGGDTPLHDACANGHIQVVKYLLEAGADFEAHNQNGVAPKDMASDEKILKLLNDWKTNIALNLENDDPKKELISTKRKTSIDNFDSNTANSPKVKSISNSRNRNRIVYDSGESDDDVESKYFLKAKKKLKTYNDSGSDDNPETKNSNNLLFTKAEKKFQSVKSDSNNYSREHSTSPKQTVDYYFSSNKPTSTREERKLKSILSTLERLERDQKYCKKPNSSRQKYENSKESYKKRTSDKKIKGLGISNISKSSDNLKNDFGHIYRSNTIHNLETKNMEAEMLSNQVIPNPPKRRRGRPPKSKDNSAVIASKNEFTLDSVSSYSSKILNLDNATQLQNSNEVSNQSDNIGKKSVLESTENKQSNNNIINLPKKNKSNDQVGISETENTIESNFNTEPSSVDKNDDNVVNIKNTISDTTVDKSNTTIVENSAIKVNEFDSSEIVSINSTELQGEFSSNLKIAKSTLSNISLCDEGEEKFFMNNSNIKRQTSDSLNITNENLEINTSQGSFISNKITSSNDKNDLNGISVDVSKSKISTYDTSIEYQNTEPIENKGGLFSDNSNCYELLKSFTDTRKLQVDNVLPIDYETYSNNSDRQKLSAALKSLNVELQTVDTYTNFKFLPKKYAAKLVYAQNQIYP